MGRAPCCDKANVKKGPWSPEEDAKLKDYIEKYGTGGNWIALPQKIGLKRCGKSCRLRWLNYLRPNIKHGGFSEEEDNIICSLYISIGSRWSIIAAQLPGRTDNDIKNYWNTKLKKKLLGRRRQANNNRNQDGNGPKDGGETGNYNYSDPFGNDHQAAGLSNSALERLQLHMQLQSCSLQNPFTNFYNNPALWPKLHPLQQQKLIIQRDAHQNPNYNEYDRIHEPDEKSHDQPAGGASDDQNQHGHHQVQLYDHDHQHQSLQQNMNYDDHDNNNMRAVNYFPVPLLDGSSVNFASSNEQVMMMMNCTAGGNLKKSTATSSDDGVEKYSNMTTVPLPPGSSSSSSSCFQAELESFLMNANQLMAAADDQIDCFKEMSGYSKWSNNEFMDTKSASSNSWDSAPAADHHEGLVFPEYMIN